MKSLLYLFAICTLISACDFKNEDKINSTECKLIYNTTTDEMTPETISIYNAKLKIVSDEKNVFKLDFRKINNPDIQNTIFISFINQSQNKDTIEKELNEYEEKNNLLKKNELSDDAKKVADLLGEDVLIQMAIEQKKFKIEGLSSEDLKKQIEKLKFILLFEDNTRFEYRYESKNEEAFAEHLTIKITDFKTDESNALREKRIKKIRVITKNCNYNFKLSTEIAEKIRKAIDCLS